MPIGFKDYYAALGVKKEASPDEVKQAYRRLAKQHHPDLHHDKDKAAAEGRFKEINEAYEVLSDPQKRAKYDSVGPGWEAPERPQAPPAGKRAEPFDGFSEFFEAMFREGGVQGFGGGSATEAGTRKGQDVEAELPLTLEDTVRGGDKTLSLLVAVLCPACRGSGRHGSRFCPACAGVGETKKLKSITAHLPKLVRDGTRLRLRGQGEPASGDVSAGDLFLRIRLLPHPTFSVAGSDLETTLTLMPWDAALGGETEVPTLEGPLRVRFPAQTHAGRRLRIPAKGLGKEGGGRGDLYAAVRIDIPERGGADIERLYKELREAGR